LSAGKLADGTDIGYKLGGPDGDKFVGRQLSKDKSWIKAKILGNPEYLACLGQDFTLTPSRLTEEALAGMSEATDFVQPETFEPQKSLLDCVAEMAASGAAWATVGATVSVAVWWLLIESIVY
jgi:hypothetical protein